MQGDERHIVGAWQDFFLLGGASLLLFPFLFFDFDQQQMLMLFVVSYFIADLLNHPHFAASYVLFYRSFKEKFRDVTYSKFFQFRYLFAGVIVPIILLLFFAVVLIQNNMLALGYAANVMFFLVGWHYTKQGYGMLIVSSVFKRRFFNQLEKNIFLVNGFIFWLLTWVYGNSLLTNGELWGVEYAAIKMPESLLYSLIALSSLSGLFVSFVILNRINTKHTETTWMGIVVYLITVYVWLLGLYDPLLLIFIPAFHSLQYLTIVYRFEVNRIDKKVSNEHDRKGALLFFTALIVVLGVIGFWIVPGLLDGVNPRSPEALFESTETFVYLFSFWIFINIHHYFIDNVLWKSENKEVKENLFA